MNRRSLLISGGAAVVILGLWYAALWSPQKSALSEATGRRQSAEATRDELTTRVARLRASQKDEPMKRAQVETLRTTIPDEPNLAAFILDTNDAASKSGIDFISVAPSEPVPAVPAVAGAATPVPVQPPGGAVPAGAGTPPAEIKLQLQINGGYFQVLDFLNRINEMPRLVVTDGLTINSDDKAKLTVGITARMFVRSVPPGYGDVPAATSAPAPAGVPATPPAASNVTNAPGVPTPPPAATAAPAVPTTTTSGARS